MISTSRPLNSRLIEKLSNLVAKYIELQGHNIQDILLSGRDYNLRINNIIFQLDICKIADHVKVTYTVDNFTDKSGDVSKSINSSNIKMEIEQDVITYKIITNQKHPDSDVNMKIEYELVTVPNHDIEIVIRDLQEKLLACI